MQNGSSDDKVVASEINGLLQCLEAHISDLVGPDVPHMPRTLFVALLTTTYYDFGGTVHGYNCKSYAFQLTHPPPLTAPTGGVGHRAKHIKSSVICYTRGLILTAASNGETKQPNTRLRPVWTAVSTIALVIVGGDQSNGGRFGRYNSILLKGS